MQRKNFIQSILILLSLIIAGTLVGSILGLVLINPILGLDAIGNSDILNIYSNNPSTPLALKFFQFFQVFFSFIIPAHLFARYQSNNQSAEYLQLKRTEPIHYIVGSLIIFSVSPLISFLNELNQNIHLPESFANIENILKGLEEKSSIATEIFLKANTLSDIFLNFFIVAILAAVSEELIFRGVLQKLMSTIIRNIHLNIFICAFIFSAFHLQFYGFIPRLILGMLLGYSFHFSKSLWVPILIHFINNGAAVAFDLLYKKNIIHINPNDNEYFGVTGLLISLISTIALFWYWTNIYKKSNY